MHFGGGQSWADTALVRVRATVRV